MTPAPKKKSRSRKKTASPGWAQWWPVALGAAATPIALRAAGVMALSGPAALRMLYPFALLAGEPAVGLAAAWGERLSQALMYLQFPLYGLLLMLVARWRGWVAGLLTLALLHLAAFGALWLLAK